MYEFNISIPLPIDQAVETVRDALMSEKLGIVSEVDVQAVFKTKLNKDIPPYRILGACNPNLADRVLAAEPNAGTLLPCNVVLRARDDSTTVVSFMDPTAILYLSESEQIRDVAREARKILERVAQSLESVEVPR